MDEQSKMKSAELIGGIVATALDGVSDIGDMIASHIEANGGNSSEIEAAVLAKCLLIRMELVMKMKQVLNVANIDYGSAFAKYMREMEENENSAD